MKLIDFNTKEVIVEKLTIADRFFSRFKGLMFTKSLNADCGMMITPCNQIHSFNMRYSIDVVFLDKDYSIVEIVTVMKPNTIGCKVVNACIVVELSCGKAVNAGLKVGQQLHIIN